MRRAVLHHAHEAPRDAREGVRRLQPVCRDTGGRIVEDDDVDIGGIVELTGAELAHAEDDHSGAGRGIGRIGQPELAGEVRGVKQVVDGGRQAGLGQRAQPPRRLGRRLQARQVGERQEQGGVLLDRAQPRHDGGLVGRRAVTVLPGLARRRRQRVDFRAERPRQGARQRRRAAARGIQQERRQRAGRDDDIAGGAGLAQQGHEVGTIPGGFAQVVEHRLRLGLRRRRQRRLLQRGQRDSVALRAGGAGHLDTSPLLPSDASPPCRHPRPCGEDPRRLPTRGGERARRRQIPGTSPR